MNAMNEWTAKIQREEKLWAESRQKEFQLVDDVLTPWMKLRNAEGIPTDQLLTHPAAAELLEAVDTWCREYEQWRHDTGMAFINSYPVEDWGDQVQPERRAATLLRVAHHLQRQGEDDRATRTRQWGIKSLRDHLEQNAQNSSRKTEANK